MRNNYKITKEEEKELEEIPLHPEKENIPLDALVILQAEKEKRLERLNRGYVGVNVEKAHCQICGKEHTIWVSYNQNGRCIVNECRNNQKIFGRWIEK